MQRRLKSAGLGWPLAAIVCLALAMPAAGDAMKVMTFNLRYAAAAEDQGSWKQWDSPNFAPQRRQVSARLISMYQPDLVGMQEGEAVQLDYLRTNLPAAYAIQQQLPSGGAGTEHAAFAYNTNKLALLDRGAFSLGMSPGGGYWNNPVGSNFYPYAFFSGMGMAFPRLSLWGHFQWRATGAEFFFYTTHFDFNNTPQLESAYLIIDDARTRAGRRPMSPLAIVVGDYNSTQANDDWAMFTGAYTYRGLAGDFTDSYFQVYTNWTYSGTIHGYNGGRVSASSRIDWILHRGGFAATQALIITNSWISTNLSTHATTNIYPSDHYPVLAALVFPDWPADFDRDGLPDRLETNSTLSLATDPDTDDDGLLDGQEDLDGDGVADGGETRPDTAGDTQNPTDIRNYAMDGILDYPATRVAAHGLDLYYRFDGRYLYVATQDAGEGSDHFIFVAADPNDAVAAPWAKAGQVSRWLAYLADENSIDYCGWFNAAGSEITDTGQARKSTYYQNGGYLEGVLDLAAIRGAGFTSAIYLAAAPFDSADGGILYAVAQAPEGNGDGNLLGPAEYVRLDPGDRDRDGINDAADPDRDGDGLPNAWEDEFGSNPDSAAGADGAGGDADLDGATQWDEYRAGTSPISAASCFAAQPALGAGSFTVAWPACQGKDYCVYRATSLRGAGNWQCVFTNRGNLVFPLATNTYSGSAAATEAYFRVGMLP